MCWIRLRRRLNKLQESVDNLYTFVKTKEYDQLKKDSLDLREEQELLSHIAFNVKSVKVFDGQESGSKVVKIYYEQPVITIDIDSETKEPIKNDIFYAINRLNLTDLQDLEKIDKVFRELKNNY